MEFLCSSERKFPELFKTHPIFVYSQLLGPSMACQTPTGIFLRHPVQSTGFVYTCLVTNFVYTCQVNYKSTCESAKACLPILEHEWTSIELTSSHLNTQGRVFTLLLDTGCFFFIGHQEQGCYRPSFGPKEVPIGFYVLPRMGANYF